MVEELNKTTQAAEDDKPKERRRHARYPFTATVEAVDDASQARIQGRTSDLSRGGCYVDTISSFPAGSVVKMRLTREDRSFEAQAEVVYSLVGMGMGVRFREMESQHFATVEKWLGELSGEAPAEPEFPPSVAPSGELGKASDKNLQVLSEVLNELLMELMREGALPNAKCAAMLRKLNGTTPS